MNRWQKTFCLFFCLLLSFTPIARTNPDESATSLDTKTIARSEIWQSIVSGRAGSATVAILDSGKFVYSEGFAMADRSQSIPVDKNTLFNIGSISKVYCATALMLLVDEGKIELDKPVITYLPEFTMADERYKRITVRMLLNHTSGLPGGSYANSFGFQYHKDFLPETLKTLSKSKLKHDPGENAVYCNDGFSLTEMIIEKISGKKFTQFLAERIFSPLSLKSTQPSVGQLAMPNKKTIARYYDPSGKKEPLEAVSFLGSGGLSATAEDLCMFFDSFSGRGPQILSARSLSEIKAAQPSAFLAKLRNPGITYGLGWDLTSLPQYSKQGITVLGKSGGTGNYNSMVFTVPDKRITVAVIGTGSAAGSMEIALKILNAYLEEKGLIAKLPIKRKLPLLPEPLPVEFFSYKGYYAADGGSIFKLNFDREKNSLAVFKTEANSETPILSAIFNNGFFYDAAGGKYYLANIEGTRLIISANFVDIILFQKIEPLDNPLKLKLDWAESFWVRRNAAHYEARMSVANYRIKPRLLADLPGYVDFAGIKKIESPSTAGLSLKTVRDASELHLFERDGATWAWVSGMIYMPDLLIKTLSSETNTVTIGREGFNEWLKSDRETVLSFIKPNTGRIVLFSPDNAVLYDSIVDKGEVYAPAGSWIELAGNAGDIIEVISTISFK